MKRIQLVKRIFALDIMCGEEIPKGYGIAWYEMRYQASVCMPIPLNWIARYLRTAYFFAVGGMFSWENTLDWRARKGYDAGFLDGYKKAKGECR